MDSHLGCNITALEEAEDGGVVYEDSGSGNVQLFRQAWLVPLALLIFRCCTHHSEHLVHPPRLDAHHPC